MECAYISRNNPDKFDAIIGSMNAEHRGPGGWSAAPPRKPPAEHKLHTDKALFQSSVDKQ